MRLIVPIQGDPLDMMNGLNIVYSAIKYNNNSKFLPKLTYIDLFVILHVLLLYHG